jgi:hypothetical protein
MFTITDYSEYDADKSFNGIIVDITTDDLMSSRMTNFSKDQMAGLLNTSDNKSMGTKSVYHGDDVFDINRHKAMNIKQIDIKETPLFNCFIKMSNFANSLGK